MLATITLVRVRYKVSKTNSSFHVKQWEKFYFCFSRVFF